MQRICNMKPVLIITINQLSPGIETIYLHSRPGHLYLSSSGVRELLKFGQDIAGYVPDSILEEIRNEKKD